MPIATRVLYKGGIKHNQIEDIDAVNICKADTLCVTSSPSGQKYYNYDHVWAEEGTIVVYYEHEGYQQVLEQSRRQPVDSNYEFAEQYG